MSAARRTLENLPADARPDERLLARAVTDPRQLLARAPRDLEPRANREVMMFAVLRMARRDLDAASHALREGSASRLPREVV